MNSPENEIAEQIRQGKELAQDLAFLQNSPEFRRVILEGYITDVLLNKSANMIEPNPALRQETMEEVMSANYCKRYLQDAQDQADAAMQYEAE